VIIVVPLCVSVSIALAAQERFPARQERPRTEFT